MNLDRDVSRYRVLNQKYGNQAMREATMLQTIAGGAAEKNAAGVARMAAEVAEGDTTVLADLVGKGRSAAMSAGRADQGGVSFGTTLGVAKDLMDVAHADSATKEMALQQANRVMVKASKDQQGAGVLAHSSMKDTVLTNLLQKVDDNGKEDLVNGKNVYERDLEAAYALPQANPTQARDRRIEIDRQLAIIADMHDQLAGTSAQKADKFAGEVLFKESANPTRVATTPSGLILPAGVAPPTRAPTIQEDMEGARDSTYFGAYRRELQTRGAPGMAGSPPGAAPGGPGGVPSDARLKKNIQYLSTTDNDIKLYSFQYIWDEQRYVGVMAQDLTESHPHALSKDSYGYYRVDYALLGLEMLTLEEWQHRAVIQSTSHVKK
jgi:hypothetical protein